MLRCRAYVINIVENVSYNLSPDGVITGQSLYDFEKHDKNKNNVSDAPPVSHIIVV